MAETSAQDVKGTERLHKYWVHGEGAAKIGWGRRGDHDRCVAQLMEHAHFSEEQAHGYCNLAEKAATGRYPSQHAAEIKKETGRSQVPDAAGESRAHRTELFRSWPLEEAHVVRTGEGDSSGRVVEAYCAVFDEPAEISDHQGRYEEEIDRAAFNKRIEDVRRSRAGFGLVKCFYSHGLTIHGTPAERFSVPCAVTEHVSAEGKGVLTRARYLDTPLGNEILEMWRSGAITAQSFTGAIIRSTPELRRGDKYRPRNGQLTRVRRLELGLREFGPTPFPAYSGAELVGVRMSPLGTYAAAAGDEYDEAALPPDAEAAPGEPPALEGDEHSARYHQHALFRLRSQELREQAGLVW